jgi:hypothetical protein
VDSLTLRRAVAFFLPAAAAFTLAAALTYLVAQQDLRIGANDLPQQLAEDGVRALDGGADPTSIVGATTVPLETSLAPFVAVFDAQGTLLASDGLLDGHPPTPPAGVLRSAQATGRDAVTWQPRAGVRIALVVVPWHGGTIAAGHSLRAADTLIGTIGSLVALGWIAGIVVLGIAAGIADWLWLPGRRGTTAPDRPATTDPTS